MKENVNEIVSFNETLKNSDLSSIIKNGIEISIDSVLNDGLLKDIPIVNTLVSLIKTAYSISTYLFLKKIIAFLDGIADIGTDKRNKMISKIDNSNKYKIKIGESLLFILDKSDDTVKASLIAKAFSSFLKKGINYSEFIKIAHIINNIFIEDFNHFINLRPESLDEEDALLYINYGICSIEFGYPDISYRESDWKDSCNESDRYSIINGENNYLITNIGKKIIEIFQDK